MICFFIRGQQQGDTRDKFDLTGCVDTDMYGFPEITLDELADGTEKILMLFVTGISRQDAREFCKLIELDELPGKERQFKYKTDKKATQINSEQFYMDVIDKCRQP